jgi:hypothetical protein
MCKTTDDSLDFRNVQLTGIEAAVTNRSPTIEAVVRNRSPKLDASLLVSLKTKVPSDDNSSSVKSSSPQPESTQLPFKKRCYSPNDSDDGVKQPAKRSATAVDSHQQTPKNCKVAEEKVPDSPTTIDVAICEHDVLCGRGGATNVHAGNIYFRSLINKFRGQYLLSRKIDKPHISRSIVSKVRARQGRFLKKNEEKGTWYEIGDDLAREKTSQALRQKAPDFRRQMADDHNRLLELTSPPSSVANVASLPQPAVAPEATASCMASMPSLLPAFAGQMQVPMMKNSADDYLMQMRAFSGVPRNHFFDLAPPSRDLVLMEYLAAKEHQARLQQHIDMVAEIDLKLRMGYHM